MRLMTFAAGAAFGYVLGTRAGREKYGQITDNARRLRANPTYAQLQQSVRDLASSPSATHAADPLPAAAEPTRPANTTGRTDGH